MFFQVQNLPDSPSFHPLNLTGASQKRRFLFSLLYLLLAGTLAAQTTWDGSSSTDWNTAANWSDGVPGANDVVTIPNVGNDPVLSTAGLAKSVIVQSGAVLTISASGSLTCNGSSTRHLTNQGTINNSGSMLMGNLQASSSYGMENSGTFNNLAGATFNLSNVSQYTRGIWNTSTGTFTNSGKVILGQYGDVGTDAIWNDGAFNNSGCSALIHIIANGDILGTGGGATFTNSGVIIENSTYTSSISNNSGIIQNLNFGSFNATTNTGLITNEAGEIWTGCTSSNWTTASNWASGAVPSAGEAVLIPDRANDPVVTTGTNTSCGFINIVTGAQLTIAASASLSIDGTGNDEALRSFGTVTNNGTLNIGSVSNGGTQGIVNQGTFSNNSGAQININRTSSAALYNYIGTFHNYGQIIIGGLASAGQHGLYNQGTFTNHLGGYIKIDQCTTQGFLISNSSTFDNNGQMVIGSVAAVGNFGFQSWGTFNNNATGEISIDRFSLYGLYNSAALTNGLVNNTGKITIGAATGAATAGVYNNEDATFNNNACGQLIFYHSFRNYSSFTNAGLIRSITTALHDNVLTLTNNGVIEYPLGNLIANVTNNDVIVKDITGSCGAYSPALTMGGLNNFNASTTWYQNVQQTTTGGTYNQATNTFTPSLPGPGTYALYFTLSGNGCSFPVTLDFSYSSDPIPPTVVCKNTTVNLSAAGTASITPASVFQSGTDNCGTVTPTQVVLSNFNCNHIGNNLVVLTASDGNGNNTTCNATVTVVDNTAPTVICKSATVNLSAGGTGSITTTSVFQSGTDNCGTVNQVSVTPNAFDCGDLGTNTVTLTVNDGHGNTGTCNATVTVADNIVPTVTCKSATVNLSAAGTSSVTTASVFQSGSDNCGTVNQQSVSPSSFTCANLGGNTVTLTVNDGHGNTATCAATVTVSDNLVPTVNCKSATVNLNAAGTGSVTTAAVFQSGSDNCGTVNQVSVVPNSFDCTDLGANTVTLTVNDGHSNTATCTATVTVADNTAPTVACKSATVNLSAGGTGSITTASVFQSGTDNCGTVNQQSVSPSSFTCANLGANTVTLTVNDGHGNTATCGATVTVADNIVPTVVCKNATVNLSAGGSASVTTTAVFQSGADNCGTVNQVSVSPASFNCGNVGANTVTLTVNDGHGNTATCTATVTVTDSGQACNSSPTAVCQNVTINANASCMMPVAATAINNGSSDPEGGSLSYALSPAGPFSYGVTSVVLTVTDNASLTATCTATVTVNDNIVPTVTCKSATVNLNAGGTGSVTTAAVFLSGSDNCGTLNQQSVSPASFTCANLGANTVTLTVNDGHGNTATCNATVTVADALAPSVTCKSAIVNLNAAGTGSITTASVFQTGSDNCGTVNQQSVSTSTFTCANLGANTVTLTVNDGHGNTSTCAATVTVNDALAPFVTCKNATVNLDAAGSGSITTASVFQSGSDNCGTVNQQSVSTSAFTCANLGANTVTLTVNDGHANTATCAATVTVADNTAPAVTCKNAAVQLDAGDSGSITTASVFQSGSDNCGTVNQQSVAPSTFNCSSPGMSTVTLTVNDGHGNTATCTATVTVTDNSLPTVTCKNATVNLGAGGSATVNPAAVFQSGSDNCGTVNPASVSPNSFSCGQIGAHVVTLTVNDGHGNTATCTATVTIADNSAPTALCKAAAVQIPAGLTATLSVGEVDNNSTDNCGVASRSLSATSFNCTNLGANTVTLTVTDVNGLSGTCTATVTVTDPNSYCCAGPQANCKAATVALNATGSASLSVSAVNNNSTHDCGLSSMAVTPNTFSCANIGANTVTLTVTDVNNHSSQCTATVTVTDPILPSITCPANIVRNTTANQCTAMVTYASPSFSDNCSGVTLARTSGPASGATFAKGTTMVNWMATDAANNSSVCNFTVTVNDNQAPTITCPPNQTKNVDAGQCSAVATYINPLASDNCTGAGLDHISGGLSGSAFPKGANAIVWQATDGGGLTSRCTFTITVNDNVAPTITCPGNQTKSTDPGLCTAVSTYPTPTFTDNCAGGSVALQSGLASGVAFPKGMTTIVWRATDAAGMVKTCSFKVTINDSEAPAIACPANQTKTTDPNQCSAVATYTNATFTDNCTGGTVVKLSGINSGSPFPKGTNQVMFKATDAAGNQSLCTMTVTVTDVQLPTVACPSNIVVTGTVSSGVCSAIVSYPTPAASDNCAILSSFLWSGMASNSVFPEGVTTNVWKVTDESGWTATCVFTVAVNCGTNSSSISPEAREVRSRLRREKLEVPAMEHEYALNMRLAPNPATTEVLITLEGLSESGGQLMVFDVQGRVVWQQSDVQHPTSIVNVSDLPPGLYQVRLQTENGVVTKALVVSRL